MNTKNTTESLSKFLAQSGVASRRKVVDIIKSGVVTVNNIVIKEPGHKIAQTDEVRVNGNVIVSQEKIYILLNKPKNCITTMSDDLKRHSVVDLLAGQIRQRIYPIGRLDRQTTGLLVLTNDGDLALSLSHPRFEVEKTYHVTLDKPLKRKDMHILLDGIELEDGVTIVESAYFFKDQSKKQCGIVLHSGKNRIVRRLFEFLGYEVVKLDRVGYAGLTKVGLATGDWRFLTNREISFLKDKK